MAVTDFQQWANYSEIVRFPLIESDVSDLQRDVVANTVLLNQLMLGFQVDIDQNTTAVEVVATDVIAAQDAANQAISRVDQNLEAARAYTDVKVVDIVADMDAKVDGVLNYIDTDLLTYVDLQVDMNLPVLESVLEGALAEADAQIAAQQALMDEFDTVTTQILNDTIPKLDTLQTQVAEDVADAKQRLDVLLTNYSFAAISEGFDDIKAQNEASLVPMAGSVLRGPASRWTLQPTLSTSTLAKPGLGDWGTFISDDPDLGECLEYVAAGNYVVAAAFPVDFDPKKVYKIAVQYKVIDDGTGNGCRTSIAVSTQQGLTSVVANKNHTGTPDYAFVADGVVTQTVYVSADIDALTTYGLDSTDYIDLSTYGAANKLFFGFRQNAYTSSSGQLRLGSIYITDITEALAGYSQLKTELSSQIGDVTADLATNYYTAASADQAIAAATLDLKTAMESPTGSVGLIQSDLSQNYYTAVDADSAIAAMETDLRAEFGTFTNGFSEGSFGDGSGDWNSTNSSVVTTTTPAMPAGVTHALELEATWVFDGPLRAGSGLGDRIFKFSGWVLVEDAVSDLFLGIQTVTGDGVTTTNTMETISTGGTVGWHQAQVSVTLPADVGQWRPFLGYTGTVGDAFVAEIFLRDSTGSEQNSAAISQESIARATADDALAAQLLTLNSTVGGVTADLENLYYTAADTDSAIALVSTELNTNIDGVSADLVTNYYTKVQVDNEADSAWEAAAAAYTAQLGAETSQGNASTSEINAASSETNAAGSEAAAGFSATAAATAESEAAGSATAAATNASAAAVSATDAGTFASSAQISEVSASTSAATSSKNLVVLGASILTTPTEAWTNRAHNTDPELLKPEPTVGSFITGDTDFGDAYDMQTGTNHTIGQAYPFSWNDQKVLEVKVAAKVIDEGTLGAQFRLGGSVASGLTVLQSNIQGDKQYQTIADGKVERIAWFTSRISADLPTELPDYVDELRQFTAAAGGNWFHPQFRQNSNGDEDGTWRVGTLEIRDVTTIVETLLAQEAAGGAASAAASSALAASASETAAGQSAVATEVLKLAAETAKSDAETSAINAASSKTGADSSEAAALTSAANAANSETASGASASAAATSAQSAQTYASDSETHSNAAQTSSLTASTAAGDATSAAGVAGGYADDAQASAEASVTSAASASASETAAGTSASAAQSDRLAAELAKGEAEVAQASAVSAKNDAEGASLSAGIASSVAVDTMERVVEIEGNFNFAEGLTGWEVEAPETNVTPITGGVLGDNLIQIRGTAHEVMSAKRVRFDPARVYQSRIRVRTTGTSGASKIYAGMAAFDNNGVSQKNQLINSSHHWGTVRNVFIPDDGEWYEYVGTFLGTAETHNSFFTDTGFITPIVLANHQQTGDFVLEVDYLDIEDVTESFLAGTYAGAAATSASNAEAHETAAGVAASTATSEATLSANSAYDADAAKTDAEAAATNALSSASDAESSRISAATSASDAQGSAATAGTAETNAVNSATDAGTNASAAANSASIAHSAATESSDSASAAQTSETEAASSESQAGIYSGEAAISESNAAGSASFAAASEAVVADTRKFITQLDGDFEFALGSESIVGANSTGEVVGTLTETGLLYFEPGTDPDVGGKDFVMHGEAWVTGRLYIPVDRARHFRLTLRMRQDAVGSGDAPTVSPGLRIFDENHAIVPDYPAWSGGYENPLHYPFGNVSLGSVGTWVEWTADIDFSTLREDARYVRILMAGNRTASDNSIMRWSLARIEDVTNEIETANYAAAAATSAQNAGVSKSDAENSATAASQFATEAESSFDAAVDAAADAQTYSGTASTQATQASNSASNALGSSNSAGLSAAAAATSQDNAGNSATAAAQSASYAETQATEASTQATAAAASKLAAETAKGEAQSSAFEAASSYEDANTAMSSAQAASLVAAQSKSDALDAEGNAVNAAAAASQSESDASTFKNESEAAAAASELSRQAAETARGDAVIAQVAAVQAKEDATSASTQADLMGALATSAAQKALIGASGNLLGRSSTTATEYDPWTNEVDVTGDAAVTTVAHGNGETHGIRQTNRDVNSDDFLFADIAGRTFQFKGAVYNGNNPYDMRAGIHFIRADDSNGWLLPTIAVANEGLKLFDVIGTVPESQTSPIIKYRFLMSSNGPINAGDHNVKWSGLVFRDITEAHTAEGHADAASLSAEQSLSHVSDAETYAEASDAARLEAVASMETAEDAAVQTAADAQATADDVTLTAGHATTTSADALSTAANVVSAQSAFTGAQGVVRDTLPSTFENESMFWTGNHNDAPENTVDLATDSNLSYTVDGTKVLKFVSTNPHTNGVTFGPKGVFKSYDGCTIRVTVVLKQVAGTLSTGAGVRLYFRRFSSDYAAYTGWTTQNIVMGAIGGFETHTFEITDTGFDYKNFRPLLQFQESNLATDAHFRVQMLLIEDVTVVKEGEGFANAASGFSQSAQTYSTNSFDHAQSAAGSATSAETQAGFALTRANSASDSVTSAAGSAQSASDSSTLATEARSAAIEAVQVIGTPMISAPWEAWSIGSNITHTNPKPALPESLQHTTDAQFGACARVNNGGNNAIGPAKPVAYDADRWYLVTYRYRTLTDGNDNAGVVYYSGANYYGPDGVTPVFLNSQKVMAYVKAVDGIQEIKVLWKPVGGDKGDFTDYDYDMAHHADATDPGTVYFHLRVNAGNITNGNAAVSMVRIEDVTALVQSEAAAKASLESYGDAFSAVGDAEAHALAAQGYAGTSDTDNGSARFYAAQSAASSTTAEDASSAASDASEIAAASNFRSSQKANGNLVGRQYFAPNEFDPFTNEAAIGDVAVLPSTGHPNGASYMLRQTNRNVYSDEIIKANLAGRRIRMRAVINAITSPYDVHMGFKLTQTDGTVTHHSPQVLAANSAVQAIDVEITVNTAALPYESYQVSLLSDGADGAADHQVDWSELLIEDITESHTAFTEAEAAAGSAEDAETFADDSSTSAAASNKSFLLAEATYTAGIQNNLAIDGSATHDDVTEFWVPAINGAVQYVTHTDPLPNATRNIQLRCTDGSDTWINAENGPYRPVLGGRTYRISGAQYLSKNGLIGKVGIATNNSDGTTGAKYADVKTTSGWSLFETEVTLSPLAYEARMRLVLQDGTVGMETNDAYRVTDLLAVDITEEDAAAGYAAEASQSETNSAQSKSDAETAQANAETARDLTVAVETRQNYAQGVINPGFETGTIGAVGVPAGWELVASKAGVIENLQLSHFAARTGSDKASILSFGTDTITAGPWWYLAKRFRAYPGQLFNFSAWAWLKEAGTEAAANAAGVHFIGEDDFYFHWIWFNADGDQIGQSASYSLNYTSRSSISNGTWDKRAVSNQTAPTNAAYMEMRLVACDGNNLAVSSNAAKLDYSEFTGNAAVKFDDFEIASANGTIIEVSPSEWESNQYRVSAGVSEDAAVTAAGDAQDALTSAEYARDVSATVYKGSAFRNPIFAQWTSNTDCDGMQESVGGSASVTKNATDGKYGNCMELVRPNDAPDTNTPGAYIRTSTHGAFLDLPSDPDEILGINLSMEIEKVSGDWGGAMVRIRWASDGNGGVDALQDIQMADIFSDENGLIQTLEFELLRPAHWNPGDGTGQFMEFRFWNATTSYGKTREVNTIRLHSWNIREVKSSATSYIQQQAIADLAGNAASSYVIRQKANAATGYMEIAAADDPINGPASKITLGADQINLAGEVFTEGNIESTNFVSGSQGFRLGIDGTAEFVNLIAQNALINGAVNTDKIGSNAVTVTRTASGSGNQSVTWTPTHDGNVAIWCRSTFEVTGSTAVTGARELKANGVVQATHSITNPDTSPDTTTVTGTDTMVVTVPTTAGVALTIFIGGDVTSDTDLLLIETKR